MNIDHDPVPASEAQPGDLILVTGSGALGELITRLDGSPFSHVGVARGDSRLLSCRTGGIDRGLIDDLGGVRDNSFDEIWRLGRNLVLGRTAAGSGREGAPAAMAAWEDTTTNDRSSFSFVKLFTVAAGLNAVRHGTPQRPPPTPDGRDQMLAAALRVGRSWAYRSQQRPAFYCAEAVAAAFGASFALEAFEPPPASEGEQVLGTEWLTDLQALAERAYQEGASRGQLWDLAKLVASISDHDHEFLGDAAKQLLEILKEAAGIETVAEEAEPDGDTLPLALVTPRMLRDAAWVEWLAPITGPA